MRVVSLFDRTGIWCAPWKDAGHEVVRVDLSLGLDVLTWEPEFDRCDVLLAAPPCQALGRLRHFCTSMTLEEGLGLVRRSVEFVERLRPTVWAIENPSGSLAGMVLGRSTVMLSWSDFGFPCRKKTMLWGEFNLPVPTTLGKAPTHVITTSKRVNRLSMLPEMKNSGRDNTPHGFALAFYEANRPSQIGARVGPSPCIGTVGTGDHAIEADTRTVREWLPRHERL